MNRGGHLPKENFGKCIGLGDSTEFVGELFVVLVKRRHLEPDDDITKEQLKEFWEEMTDQNFDSRTFSLACKGSSSPIKFHANKHRNQSPTKSTPHVWHRSDKNNDGMLTEDEVKEVIILSTSTNKLAFTYTSLIMEELDPDDRGYIEIWQLETLLHEMMSAQVLEKLTMIPSRYWNPLKRHISKMVDFIHENWKRIWLLTLWLLSTSACSCTSSSSIGTGLRFR